jgi:hypothetical protein
MKALSHVHCHILRDEGPVTSAVTEHAHMTGKKVLALLCYILKKNFYCQYRERGFMFTGRIMAEVHAKH